MPERRDAGATYPELQAADVPRSVEWILLTGARWAVSAGLLLAIFLTLTVLLGAGVVAVEDTDALTRSFVALIGGNMTLITIVISINQLILSREFGTPDELRDRIQDTVDFRQEVADLAETAVSPTTPGSFLDFLVTVVREETAALRDADRPALDEARRTELEELTDVLGSQAEHVSETLEGAPESPFEPLRVVLNIDFAADLYNARRIRSTCAEALSSDARAQIDRVIEALEHIGVMRQYLKTLYFQRELAGLSRKILLVGIPAVVLLLVTTWTYGSESAPTVQGPALEGLVVLTATVAFAPLAVFFAYVLRIATITRRTPSLVPFEIRDEGAL